jgi:hypothetical protein
MDFVVDFTHHPAAGRRIWPSAKISLWQFAVKSVFGSFWQLTDGRCSTSSEMVGLWDGCDPRRHNWAVIGSLPPGGVTRYCGTCHLQSEPWLVLIFISFSFHNTYAWDDFVWGTLVGVLRNTKVKYEHERETYKAIKPLYGHVTS